jgi:hypothetical protein
MTTLVKQTATATTGKIKVTAKTNVTATSTKVVHVQTLTTAPVPVSTLRKKIAGYASMTQYQRQKAMDALSVPRTLKRLTNNCKSKAIRDNKEFDIDHAYLLKLWKAQKGLCAYSGTPLTLGSGTHRNPNPNRVSVDRRNNAKGYIKGNLQLVNWQANQAKGSGTPQALVTFCKAVATNN